MAKSDSLPEATNAVSNCLIHLYEEWIKQLFVCASNYKISVTMAQNAKKFSNKQVEAFLLPEEGSPEGKSGPQPCLQGVVGYTACTPDENACLFPTQAVVYMTVTTSCDGLPW